MKKFGVFCRHQGPFVRNKAPLGLEHRYRGYEEANGRGGRMECQSRSLLGISQDLSRERGKDPRSHEFEFGHSYLEASRRESSERKKRTKWRRGSKR